MQRKLIIICLILLLALSSLVGYSESENKLENKLYKMSTEYLSSHWNYLVGIENIDLSEYFIDQKRIDYENGRNNHWQKWLAGISNRVLDFKVIYELKDTNRIDKNNIELTIYQEKTIHYELDKQPLQQMCTYHVNLTYDNQLNKWYISSQPYYDDYYEVSDLDRDWIEADKYLDNYFETREKDQGKIMLELKARDEEEALLVHSTEYRTYNREDAVTYALKYTEGYQQVGHEGNCTCKYNNFDFQNFASSYNDCQNFASQCVWRGFGGVEGTTSSLDFPMLYYGLNGCKWYCSKTKYTYTWSHCTYFRNMVKENTSDTSRYGILGKFYENGDPTKSAYMEKGDLVYCKKGHAWVIVKTGSSYEDIYVSAHTYNRRNYRLANWHTASDFEDYNGIWLHIKSWRKPTNWPVEPNNKDDSN